jgi:hypothetical protein
MHVEIVAFGNDRWAQNVSDSIDFLSRHGRAVECGGEGEGEGNGKADFHVAIELSFRKYGNLLSI